MHIVVWHCTPSISDDMWRKESRMTWASFNILCDLLRPCVKEQVTKFRAPIEVEQALAMTLKMLAF